MGGTLLAPVYTRWLGLGRAYVSGLLLASLAGIVLAAASGQLTVTFVIVGQLLTGLGFPLYGVPQRTLRQALVPEYLLGRVTATWRTLVIGCQTFGALLGGVLGTAAGLRPTLVISSLGMLLGFTWAARSPLRSLRDRPDQAGDNFSAGGLRHEGDTGAWKGGECN